MNKTTCQICEREIKANTGVIAHHGYTRPGWGEQTGSCIGARELPYEVSREAIPGAILSNQKFVHYQNERLDELMAGPDTLTEHRMYHPSRTCNRPEGFDAKANLGSICVPSDPYEREHRNAVRQVERNIKEAKSEIARLERRFADWVPAS